MAEREQLKREQLRREQSGRRTGLVLEGGGMRGIYTAGILDVFMEAGVHFDGVIGVSAGAHPRMLLCVRAEGPEHSIL